MQKQQQTDADLWPDISWWSADEDQIKMIMKDNISETIVSVSLISDIAH